MFDPMLLDTRRPSRPHAKSTWSGLQCQSPAVRVHYVRATHRFFELKMDGAVRATLPPALALHSKNWVLCNRA